MASIKCNSQRRNNSVACHKLGHHHQHRVSLALLLTQCEVPWLYQCAFYFVTFYAFFISFVTVISFAIFFLRCFVFLSLCSFYSLVASGAAVLRSLKCNVAFPCAFQHKLHSASVPCFVRAFSCFVLVRCI